VVKELVVVVDQLLVVFKFLVGLVCYFKWLNLLFVAVQLLSKFVVDSLQGFVLLGRLFQLQSVDLALETSLLTEYNFG
jgi:hypothetical protein